MQSSGYSVVMVVGIANQIRAFLLERGIAVRQGLRFLRQALPDIMANRADAPRMVSMIEDLAGDLHHLDQDCFLKRKASKDRREARRLDIMCVRQVDLAFNHMP